MQFGKYPQWIIEQSEISGAEVEKYFKVGIDDVVYINNDETEKHVYIDWEQHKDDVFYFKDEPIVWRVLEETEDTLFVLSEYNIECKQFHQNEESVVWENSSLRKWLNNEFYYRAFNNEEQECILEIVISNEFNPVYFAKGGRETQDKIFLLSFRDVLNTKLGFESYIPHSVTREAKNTDWVRIMGALTNPEKGMGWWWLRSPGENNLYTGRCDYSGAIYFSGLPITMFGSIRPVMYLDKRKIKSLGIEV